jgi:hypothetical protein
LDYILEIIEDPALLVDSIEAPSLSEIQFITGYDSTKWQECSFLLKTSDNSEAAFCGSFTYSFSSESGIDQYVS